MNFKWWILLLLLCLVVVFTLQNYETVELQFLFWSVSVSRVILILVTLVIGIIIGLILRKME